MFQSTQRLIASILLLFMLLTVQSFFTTPSLAHADASFQQWIKDFYPKAAAQGITQKTYNEAFAGVISPSERVIKSANYQPEFTTEIWEYLDARVNAISIKNGQKMAEQYASTLDQIERQFGISRYVILAIWSMESNYGAIFNRPERLHSVTRALATLAYADPKRRKFAEGQLIAALKILQNGDIDAANLTGSWAGAMGHTQFIPTSYLAYGVDMDGDGRRDIWNSVPDALATAAQLLHKNSWQPGKTWGYEVKVPASYDRADIGETKTLAQWQQLGFSRVNGRAFPRPGDKAILKMLSGDTGPGFLMLKNFFVIKRYNNSDFYALAVGLLADRLAGYPGMIQPWPRPKGALNADEKFELQERLLALGYYDGEVDGNIGPNSRKAIRAFQQAAGLEVTAMADKDLLEVLRQR